MEFSAKLPYKYCKLERSIDNNNNIILIKVSNAKAIVIICIPE